MTEDNMQVLRDDIAFMRDLAHDGSSAPLLFGGVMVAAGLIFGIASIGHWLIATGVLQLPPSWLLANWLTAAGVFGAAWFVAGEMSRQGWIKLVALAAFVGAVVVGALATSPHLMLACAAWLVLVAVVPGIVLMRREPAATA